MTLVFHTHTDPNSSSNVHFIFQRFFFSFPTHVLHASTLLSYSCPEAFLLALAPGACLPTLGTMATLLLLLLLLLPPPPPLLLAALAQVVVTLCRPNLSTLSLIPGSPTTPAACLPPHCPPCLSTGLAVAAVLGVPCGLSKPPDHGSKQQKQSSF